LGVGARCPLACFSRVVGLRSSCEIVTLECILFSLKSRLMELLGAGWPRREGPPKSPWRPAQWLTVAPLTKLLSAWAAKDWLVLPPHAHILRYRDGWRLVLVHDRPSSGAYPDVVAGHSPSGKLSAGEGQWIKFICSVDIVSGSAHVSHDCCARVFLWKVLGIDARVWSQVFQQKHQMLWVNS